MMAQKMHQILIVVIRCPLVTAISDSNVKDKLFEIEAKV